MATTETDDRTWVPHDEGVGIKLDVRQLRTLAEQAELFGADEVHVFVRRHDGRMKVDLLHAKQCFHSCKISRRGLLG